MASDVTDDNEPKNISDENQNPNNQDPNKRVNHMPTIGWFEILIVVAIAIIVLGPKDFSIMLKKVGSMIGTAKKYITNIQKKFPTLILRITPENDEKKVKKDDRK